MSKEPLCQIRRSESIWFSLLRTEKSKKLELFKIPVLLVVTGKPQTLARDIPEMQVDPFFSTCSSSAALSHMM